jgi:hypothetical protein
MLIKRGKIFPKYVTAISGQLPDFAVIKRFIGIFYK